jgi:hypothetical protein
MFELFAREAAPEIKERIAKVNLLLPTLSDARIADCQALIDAALKAETRPGFLNWYYTTKGIAEYRAGRDQDAIKWLSRTLVGEFGVYPQRQANLFLAMAQHKLKLNDQAQAVLKDAADALAAVTDDQGRPIMPSDGNLIDWAYAQVARREAEKLLSQP